MDNGTQYVPYLAPRYTFVTHAHLNASSATLPVAEDSVPAVVYNEERPNNTEHEYD